MGRCRRVRDRLKKNRKENYQRRKEGEDGEERELERSSTYMQFVNVRVEVLTAMLMKFTTLGHMTLQQWVCRDKCLRKSHHLIFKVYHSLHFPED